MVLNVPFENLAEEAKRHGIKPWAYLKVTGAGCTATLGDPQTQTVIQAQTSLGRDQASQALAEQGLMVATGRWLPDPLAGELQVESALWVATVAYRSNEDKPGLWVQAYRGEPSDGDVLREFYEEMCQEALLEGVTLDDFLDSVSPNVLVFGPDELAAFADSEKGC